MPSEESQIIAAINANRYCTDEYTDYLNILRQVASETLGIEWTDVPNRYPSFEISIIENLLKANGHKDVARDTFARCGEAVVTKQREFHEHAQEEMDFTLKKAGVLMDKANEMLDKQKRDIEE